MRALESAANHVLSGTPLDPSALSGIQGVFLVGKRAAVEYASLVACCLSEKELISVIRNLSSDRRLKARLGVLMCLRSSLPYEFLHRILGLLVVDKSKKVRKLAVDWIMRNFDRRFLELLESIEPKDSERAFLSDQIHLLRHGYLVSRSEADPYVIIKDELGSVAGFFSSVDAENLPDAEIARRFRARLSQRTKMEAP
jgi:hypothetical protein